MDNNGLMMQFPGLHGIHFFCSMYEMSQRHPVWVTENHVNPCNSVGHKNVLDVSKTLKKESVSSVHRYKNVLDVSKTLKKESVSSVHRYKNVLDVSKTIKKESVSMYRG